MTASCATCALVHFDASGATRARERLRAQLTPELPRVAHVIEQTTRRVLDQALVPATEKLVSLYEAHADVIVTNRQMTHYDYRVFLTTGRSGLILDCALPEGNPADATWAVARVRRHGQRFGTAPQLVSMDGGFASRQNLAAIRARGVIDMCFAKKRGLTVGEMTRSQWVYDKLRRFGASIEAGISLLKRVLGLARCVWKGAKGFHAYVHTAVLAANVLLVARTRLT